MTKCIKKCMAQRTLNALRARQPTTLAASPHAFGIKVRNYTTNARDKGRERCTTYIRALAYNTGGVGLEFGYTYMYTFVFGTGLVLAYLDGSTNLSYAYPRGP